MKRLTRKIGCAALVLVTMLLAALSTSVFGQTPIDVRIVTDEADAVLRVLDKQSVGKQISDSDWRNVFDTEGYARLRSREHSFNRKFEDEDFKAFLLSPGLSNRREALRKTLSKWMETNVENIGKSVLRYLPDSARIKAKIYPVIKPATNSFVFDLDRDPAIFLYLDENLSREKFENTLAHELHHIGFGTACPPADAEKEIDALPEGKRKVLRWTGAFGEGFAMLAAAGGPGIHPHEASEESERSRWDSDVVNFDSDLLKVQSFFLDLLAGKLSEREEIALARSFYGIQGPWYTVGWKMAVVIEEESGRPALIDCFCDGRKLLPAFNKAAAARNRRTGEELTRWDQKLLWTKKN